MNDDNDKHRAIPEISIDSLTLYRAIVKLEEGEMLTYEDLSEMIKRDVQNGAYPNLQTARRRAMRLDLISTITIRGEGIKRTPNGEIADVSRTYLEQARRKTKTGMRTLACADFNKLDPDGKRAHNAQAAVMGTLSLMLKPKKLDAIEAKMGEAQDTLSMNATLKLFED